MVKILVKVKDFENNFNDWLFYYLDEGFSICYSKHTVALDSLRNKKFYRVYFRTTQSQKFVVEVLRHYFYAMR